METQATTKAPRGLNLKKMAIWTVLVLMLVSSLAVLPDDASAQAPGNKDITFYFHNVSAGASIGPITTMRIMNTTQGDTLNVSARSSKSVQYDFYLYPVLADNTTVQNNVTVHIWARRIATSGDNRNAAFIMRLYDVNQLGVEVAQIASATKSYDMMTAWTEYSISATSLGSYTVDTGHSIRVYVEIDGSSSNEYQMAWGDTTRKSRVDIEMSDYVRINDVDTLDHQRASKTIFSQLTANKTMYFAANVTDPYGGYDIKWVNATVVAPNGTIVVDHGGMDKTKGYFNSYYSEFEYTWNYSGYPTGQYNLTVDVVDWTGYYYRYPTNPGDTSFGGHLESMTVSFWIGGMPHNVTINVTDDLDAALPGAEVSMGPAGGTTDANGQVVLRLANGTYDLSIYWQDTVVYSQSKSVSNDTWIDAKVAVFSPTIVCEDDVGDPVFDAVVFTRHPNGTLLGQSWRTDQTGSIDWTTMAGGDYRMSVMWMGVEVYNATKTLNGQGPFTLTLRVYQLDIQVVDSVGDGLELAQVVIINSTNGLVADSKLTNFTGHTMSKVPIGSFDFKVYWRNELVFDSLNDHLIDASGPLVLSARIYAVDLTVVDASDQALTNARVVVGFAVSGQIHDFGTTDDTGTLRTRLPVGYYNFWVYWKDVLVNETLNFYFDGTGQHTIHAKVYWVDVHVQDTENVSVVSALVTLKHSDGLDFGTVSTDDDGNTSYRLPIGDYRIVVAWKDTVVYDQVRLIDSQDAIVLTVAIYYMRLHVVDSRDVAVENALVATHNDTSGAIVGSSVTDEAGNITHRVPMGTYRVQIVWQEAIVHEAMRTVDHNDPVTVVVNVFYVDIHVRDTLDVPLEGAMISFTNTTSGRSMGIQATSDDGNVSYRAPIGDYQLSVIWQEALVHQSNERVDTDRALTITASVYYAFITVVDTAGEPLTGAQMTVTNPVTGRIMGSQTTDADGNATYRLPMANYSIEIVWLETVVYDAIRMVDNNDPMVLVASVYYAELHVVDSLDVPLESALVTFTNDTSGRHMGEHTTPADGIVTFRLPMNHYDIEVTWQETVVWHRVLLLNTNDPLVVVANVYYAELHVMDSKDVPLEQALVTFTNDTSGRVMGERTTGADGIITFRLPMGEYDVVVVWKEAVVWHDMRLLDDNVPWDVVTNVFYGQLNILDSMDVPVETALVSLTNATSGRPMGDRTTGNDGQVVYRIPMGVYTVQVLWKDTVVFDDFITIDSNVPHDIVVDVYYPTFDVFDSGDFAVSGALVTMAKWPSGRIMGSQLTDGEGSVTFRMPKDTYTVSIVWLDTLVHQDTYAVVSNDAFTVAAMVYYVDLTSEDSKGVGLEFAQIGVTNTTSDRTLASHTANADGESTFRLPIGEYRVDVLWANTLVYEDVYMVDDDADWTLVSWVYYVKFHVTDGQGIDLAGASVALENAAAMTSAGPLNTDWEGNIEFRLANGTVDVEVVWGSLVVYTETDLPVHADATEEVSAWVYYLTVRITDSKGVKLKDAVVTVDRDGVIVESARTPRNGTLVFRLPKADYWANMSFKTTYYLTAIDVSKSEQVDLSGDYIASFKLTKDDYPIPFYKTNLFWVILVMVLLILGLVFLLYRMRKAALEGEPVDDEGKPIEYNSEDLDDLLEDIGATGSIAAGAAAGAAAASGDDAEPEEYSDDDLEEEDEGEGKDEGDEEPEEYSDEDLEEGESEDEGEADEGSEEPSDEDPEEEDEKEGD